MNRQQSSSGSLRHIVRCIIGCTVLIAGTGCATMGQSNTARSALLGGTLGTGGGALIGSASGNAGKGALIGGVAGTLLGAMIGNEEDRREEATAALEQQRIQQEELRQLGITEVIQMTKDGISEDIISNQIRTTGSRFDLTASDIRLLRDNGVSDKVILEMQNNRGVRISAPAPGPTVIVHEPPPIIYAVPPRPRYYVRPCPPPPLIHGHIHIR
ncbi:MAG: glycine zipper domain-containing protein [Zavarzinella sp.]